MKEKDKSEPDFTNLECWHYNYMKKPQEKFRYVLNDRHFLHLCQYCNVDLAEQVAKEQARRVFKIN